MNRIDFQEVCALRLYESKALLNAGMAEGAYYLAGYVIECAFKACISKRTREHDFPERESKSYYSHDLEELLGLARLRVELDQEMRVNPAMRANWIIVKNWSEQSRYEKARTTAEATQLLNAIEDAKGGLLPWLQRRW